MDEDESALEFGTNSGYVETIRQLAKEGKQEELSREVQAWVHDSWSWLPGGRTPHEAREKIAEQEFSERMVLLERLVILLQPFLRQCATAAFWQVQDSLRSVQRDVSALQSDSNAVHDAVEQLRREVEALRMPAVQSHGNEEPQSPVCVAVAPSAPGSSSSPNSSLGSPDATPQSSPKGKRGRRAGQAVRRRQAAQSLLEILDGIAAPAKGARHSKG